MTFLFLIFTITIKKRHYSKADLERFLHEQKHEQKIEERKREQESKHHMYLNWY